jgi:DnaJ-domain-containing protein 1
MVKSAGFSMFDSGSKSAAVNRALVALTLRDGSVLNVSLKLSLTSKIADALNNAEQFLDAVTVEGEQLFISKADVRQARLLDVPKANQLNLQRRASDRSAFNPYAVLKVAKEATPQEIRDAYHRMSRLYHPDRLGAYELPEEVHDYARAVQVRINLAYEQIGK